MIKKRNIIPLALALPLFIASFQARAQPTSAETTPLLLQDICLPSAGECMQQVPVTPQDAFVSPPVMGCTKDTQLAKTPKSPEGTGMPEQPCK